MEVDAENLVDGDEILEAADEVSETVAEVAGLTPAEA